MHLSLYRKHTWGKDKPNPFIPSQREAKLSRVCSLADVKEQQPGFAFSAAPFPFGKELENGALYHYMSLLHYTHYKRALHVTDIFNFTQPVYMKVIIAIHVLFDYLQ